MIKIPNLHTHVLRQVKTEEAEAGLITDFAEEAEAVLLDAQPKAKMQKTSKAKPRPKVKVEQSSSSASGQNPQWG